MGLASTAVDDTDLPAAACALALEIAANAPPSPCKPRSDAHGSRKVSPFRNANYHVLKTRS